MPPAPVAGEPPSTTSGGSGGSSAVFARHQHSGEKQGLFGVSNRKEKKRKRPITPEEEQWTPVMRDGEVSGSSVAPCAQSDEKENRGVAADGENSVPNGLSTNVVVAADEDVDAMSGESIGDVFAISARRTAPCPPGGKCR